jgi:hypothetical protein
MAVKFTGGSSGNRTNGLPPVPNSGQSQPIPITTTNAPDATKYPTCKSTTPAGNRGNAVMPTGGNNPIEGGAV